MNARRIQNDHTLDEDVIDGYFTKELNCDQLMTAEQAADARPGGAIRMGYVIERIIARQNLERPVSPSARKPAPLTSHRAGPSGLNTNLPPFRRRVASSDKDEPKRLVWPPHRLHLEFDDEIFEQTKDV